MSEMGKGMSRAAQKRAKKKQKQQQKQKREDEEVPAHKRKKLELPIGDEEDDICPAIDDSINGGHEKKQNSLMEDTQKAPENKEEHGEGEEEMEKIVESILCRLDLKDILFPPEEEESPGEAESPEPDPRALIRDVTAVTRARILLSSMLRPSGLQADEFYEQYWEKKPLLVQLNGEKVTNKESINKNYRRRFDGFLSKSAVAELLENCALRYGQDLNVTRYDGSSGDGVKRRVTLDILPEQSRNGGGAVEYVVADPKDVWSNFSSGCTIRLLCPQKHSDEVHALLSTLEHEFGCMVGANAYLTPGNSSQGFAPHYDDIDAFIVQLEGYKQWKVYPPRRGEALPRESSRDFTEKEIEDVEPIIDVLLGPGDILYMPRGWVHQACTSSDRDKNGHSLHLTISVMQSWAWVDLLELILPEALQAAAQSENSTSLREGLPRKFLDYVGVIHESAQVIPSDPKEGGQKEESQASEDDDSHVPLVGNKKLLRDRFIEEGKKRIMRVCKEAIDMLDAGSDQLSKRFLSDRLPPALTTSECALTNENREQDGKIWPNTMVRLVRPGIARLVLEDGKAVLYHCADNSRVYRGNPLSPMEFETDDAPALEMILTTVEPHWICVQDLLHGDIEDKMEIAQSLYNEGILAISQPHKPDRSVVTG